MMGPTKMQRWRERVWGACSMHPRLDSTATDLRGVRRP